MKTCSCSMTGNDGRAHLVTHTHTHKQSGVCSVLRFCLRLPGWRRCWRRERRSFGPSTQICSRKIATSQVSVTPLVLFCPVLQWQRASVNIGLVPPGLRGELRAEEEKLKEKEREGKDLEETVELLKKELNKTEQARKDASIKVRLESGRLV